MAVLRQTHESRDLSHSGTTPEQIQTENLRLNDSTAITIDGPAPPAPVPGRAPAATAGLQRKRLEAHIESEVIIAFAGRAAYLRQAPSRPMSSAPDTLSAALESIVANFDTAVRRVARRYRLFDADVDEVMQEVRIRLWRAHPGGGQGREKIEQVSASYVYRTAVSAAIDMLRRRRARHQESTVSLDQEEVPESDASDPTHAMEQSELAAQVARAIETITPSRRPIVRMHLAGYSREEIAALMGWSEAKTRNLLYRGLADLRERLTEMGITCETTG